MSADALDRARVLLRERFGHEDFTGLQEEVITELLAGRDALVVMPTGGGKSLCYQLPALVLPGLTVVLSPLIALMQDQVESLRKIGVPATFVNSSLDRAEREKRLAEVRDGRWKLLYVTPERFRKPAFRRMIAALPIALLAVDEAHCISSWGHDFRPEYGRVGRIREALGRPPTVALTATATPSTQADIRARLDMADARLFHAGIGRPNLHIGVRDVADEDERLERVLEVIGRLDGAGIVYFALIRDLREMEERLARIGRPTLVYHGGLSAYERRAMQRRFMASKDAVVLATNAFGMGVDKADIRFILHAQIPGSIEAWYQEIGRAGRDGRPALCELLYRSEDLMIQKQFIEWSNPDAAFVRAVWNQLRVWGENAYAHDLQDLRETLLLRNRHDGRPETVLGLLRAEGHIAGDFERGDLRIVRELEPGDEERLVTAGKRERDLGRLLEMLEAARDDVCRRRRLDRYFGFPEGPDCGHCDVCIPTEVFLEAAASRPAAPAPPAAAPVSAAPPADAPSDDEDAPVARGDWLLIDGRHHVVVRKVEKTPRGFRIEAESAGDLRVRSYDLDRVRWSPVS